MDCRRALVIEDDPDQATLLRGVLERLGFKCDVEEDGLEGYLAAARGGYSLAIVDSMLPHMVGPEIVARLRADGSRMPIIILSALATESHSIQGLNKGADDYIYKPCSLGELQARIEALLRRSSYGEERKDSRLVYKDIVLDTCIHRVTRNGRLISLTPMEYNLLEYLVRNQGRLAPAATIVSQVWGFDAGTSRNLMATRLSQLRRKIVAKGESDPIVTRRGFGYGLL